MKKLIKRHRIVRSGISYGGQRMRQILAWEAAKRFQQKLAQYTIFCIMAVVGLSVSTQGFV